MSVLVNEKQKGNPLLKFIRIVPWTFAPDIIPDYVVGSTCAIFISIKYHVLHPKHAERRIREVGKNFRLRVLLALVDDDSDTKSLQELNKLCFLSDFVLILAWSNEEAARYLETLKSYESKPLVAEKVETEFLPKLSKIMSSVKSVNKTDVVTLLDVFGTFGGIATASEEQIVLCPGIGERKVKRLYRALHEPFLKSAKRTHNDSVYTRQQPKLGQQTTGEGGHMEEKSISSISEPAPADEGHGDSRKETDRKPEPEFIDIS